MLIPVALALCSVTAVRGQNLFKENEWSLSFYGDYVDRGHDDVGLGFGGVYFLNTYFGVGASTHWEHFDDKAVENLSGEVYLRYPLQNLPLAPYVLGGAGHSWEEHQWFGLLGFGADYRLNERWGLFGDYQRLFNDRTDDRNFLRFGARFIF